jgi:5-methylcytosine-specific restriction endonuclease McrA
MAKSIVGIRRFSVTQRRAMRAALIEKYGAVCQICKEEGKNETQCAIELNAEMNSDLGFSFDHIVALADGGRNHISNMWPAHRACNTRKGSKSGGTPRKYRRDSASTRLAYTSVSA